MENDLLANLLKEVGSKIIVLVLAGGISYMLSFVLLTKIKVPRFIANPIAGLVSLAVMYMVFMRVFIEGST